MILMHFETMLYYQNVTLDKEKQMSRIWAGTKPKLDIIISI